MRANPGKRRVIQEGCQDPAEQLLAIQVDPLRTDFGTYHVGFFFAYHPGTAFWGVPAFIPDSKWGSIDCLSIWMKEDTFVDRQG